VTARAASAAPERLPDQQPTILARISHEELDALFRGYRLDADFVEGDDPARCISSCIDHGALVQDIRKYPVGCAPHRQGVARALADDRAAQAQGLDGNRRRSRQDRGQLLALAPGTRSRCAHQLRDLKLLEKWMQSYRPRNCSTRTALVEELRELAPMGRRA